eukprot:s965_g33.t1
MGVAERKLIVATRVGSSTLVTKNFWSGVQRVTRECFRVLDSMDGLGLCPSARHYDGYEVRVHASDIQRTCDLRNMKPLRRFFPPVAASFEAPFLASVAC